MKEINPTRLAREQRIKEWLDDKDRTHKKAHPFSKVIKYFFEITGLSDLGFRNTQKIKTKRLEFTHPNIGSEFNNFKIMFISDFHLNGNPLLIHPIAKILKEEKVDIIGLSGLITPSLDEMVHVAKEMKRQAFELPLLIGGATTSKAHTAVKIEPQYEHPVVYVPNASRSVSVVSTLLSDQHRSAFVERQKAEYVKVRERHYKKGPRSSLISLKDARANAVPISFDHYTPKVPNTLGVTVLDNIDLSIVRNYIDWTPFFMTWQLSGKYPLILKHEVVGEEATKLFNDANAMIGDVIANNK